MRAVEPESMDMGASNQTVVVLLGFLLLVKVIRPQSYRAVLTGLLRVYIGVMVFVLLAAQKVVLPLDYITISVFMAALAGCAIMRHRGPHPFFWEAAGGGILISYFWLVPFILRTFKSDSLEIRALWLHVLYSALKNI